MNIFLQIILWISIFLIFHTYVGFPFLLFLLKRKKSRKAIENIDFQEVTILMSLYNEEAVIAKKLDSIFHSDYPSEKIFLLIGSDHSDDHTNEIVERYTTQYPNITFHSYDERRGKCNVINQLMKEVTTDFVIFTDANVLFTPQTISELMKGFSDPEVGLVDSNMQNTGIKEDGISIPERAYISREVRIKNSEGVLWGTMMGPFGGCFALRKELYRPIPQNFMVDDFFICMKVLALGKDAINNVNAVVYEDVSNNLSDEFRRKIRIATGDFQNLFYFFPMLCSPRKGLSFCFLSHKVLRWFTPLLLIFYYIANLFLLFGSPFYLTIFILFNALLLLIPLDFLLKRRGIHCKILRFITHFFSMNIALLVGMVHAMQGVESAVWKPTARNQ